MLCVEGFDIGGFGNADMPVPAFHTNVAASKIRLWVDYSQNVQGIGDVPYALLAVYSEADPLRKKL
jgi:hypothetical protein